MKKTTIAVVTLLTMSFAGAAFAAPGQAPAANANAVCPGYTQSYHNMTDEEKAQMANRQKQMLEQRKLMIQQQVDAGYISQEQANQRMAWMDQNMTSGAMRGSGMMMRGSGMGNGMMGPGMGMNGFGMGNGMGYGMMNAMVSDQRL